LTEGSAGVTYEALAAGVPVITTAAAGSVVRDGADGVIVPERDTGVFAEAIVSIVNNRQWRDELAASARERAAGYTWPRYGERLLAALRSMNEVMAANCQS
jgi:glycosyltransferase involved in cell wall biosynthesis